MKVTEGYCWAITQAAERSCCGRSGSIVLECGFQLDSLVHTQTVDRSQCLLNSHLRPPSPPALPNKYSTYHLQFPTNIALTNYSAQQIQHLPPTVPNKYSTYQLQCPTNTALTTYSVQQIQHLPTTLPDKYSTYHLHCPTNIALTNYSAQQIQHLPPTLPDKYSTYQL